MIQEYDCLRTPKTISVQDSRNESLENIIGSPKSLEDLHKYISEVQLHEYVPENIRIRFETTRNLYLYSWFVYRFFAVAEFDSLTCLEFALKEKYQNDIDEWIKEYYENRKGKKFKEYIVPGLKRLLKHARNDGHIIYENQDDMKQSSKDGEEIENDPITSFIEDITLIRNTYAHGSVCANPGILNTISIVAEIINQLYSGKDSNKKV